MVEIERKFLVKNNNFKKEAFKKTNITQAFLNKDKNRVVRIRISNEKAYLTVKGPSNKSGTSRLEWEIEIKIQDAKLLLPLCEPHVISKVRYYVKKGNHLFEIDCFHEENYGLVIAEIELKSEAEYFEKPEWLGKEVTGDPRYYNSMLSKNPYTNW